MNNCHHRLLRVLHQAVLAVAFCGAIVSGPAQAQTWYLRPDLTWVWFSHPAPPGRFIGVAPSIFQASFSVPGQGVSFEAHFRLPDTMTTATTSVPLWVTMTGPDRITNSTPAAPPTMTLVAIGNNEPTVQNGYFWKTWDVDLNTYVYPRADPFPEFPIYAPPTNNYVMQGLYALGGDEVTYQIRVSGNSWDVWGNNKPNEIRVFYTYSRTPPPPVDELQLSNPMPNPAMPLIGGTRMILVGDLGYSLGTCNSADLMLVVETNNVPLTKSERVRISRTTDRRTISMLTFAFTVPTNTTTLAFKAVMLQPDSDLVITQTTATVYSIINPKYLPIAMGTVRESDEDGFTFNPTTITRFYSGVNIRDMLWQDDVAFEVQLPEQSPEPGRRLSLVLIASLESGMGFSDILCSKDLGPGENGRITLRPPTDEGSDPIWQLMVERGMADHLEFHASLMSAGGEVTSRAIYVPVERITWSRTTHQKLVFGDKESRFTAEADYHADLAGERELFIDIGISVLDDYIPYFHDLFASAIFDVASYPAGTLTPPPEAKGTIKFNRMLPISATEVSLLTKAEDSTPGQVYARVVMQPAIPPLVLSLWQRLETQMNLDLRAPAAESFGIRLEAVNQLNPAAIAVMVSSLPVAILANALSTFPTYKTLWLNQTWAFDPALPADGSFSALLTLAYDPTTMPDDPSFDENRIEIISYNPQTGQFRSYPTMLDRSNRLASASINSLDQFWTLGATPRGSGSVLNYPMLQSKAGFPTGIIAVNSSTQTTAVTLTAYDNNGSIIAGNSITNPVTANLAALQAAEWTPGGLFNINPSYQDGWVQLRSSSSGVAGLLRLQTASRAEAITAGAPSGVRFLMPGIVADTNTACELHVINPTAFNGSVVFTLVASNGQAVATNSADLPAKARLSANLTNLFPALTLPFAGYLRAQGDVEMTASALLVRPSSLVALSSQPLPFEGAAIPNGWAARYTTGGAALRSRLALVNAATNLITYHLEAVRDNGTVRTAADVSVPPGSQFSDELSHLFGWSLDTESTGSLRVSAPGGFLAGNLQVTDAASNSVAATAWPLATTPAGRFVFPLLNLEPGRLVEVSVLNPQSASVTVGFTVHGTNGALIGTTNLVLAAGARLTRPLTDCIPASAGLVAGFVLVTATQPVVVEALAGETSGNTLLAIPAVVSPLASNLPANPTIEIVPAGLGFGSVLVGGSLLRAVEIRNVGTGPLTVQSLSSGDPRVAISAPGTPFNLAMGETRTVNLQFTPTSANLWTGSVTVASSDPMRGQVVVPLSGRGAVPALEITRENNTVLVSWPAEAGDYHLQTSLAVMSPSWTNQPGPPTVVSNRMQMIIPTGSQPRFFRLAR